jgi:hypothetical protein
MRFSDIAGMAWALAVGGGALALAAAYALVLLQRRRASGKLECSSDALAPEAEARMTGRALHPEDLISCVGGLWICSHRGYWVISKPARPGLLQTTTLRGR